MVEDPAANHCSKEGPHYHRGAKREESCHETCDKCHMVWVRWKSRCEVFVARKARAIALKRTTRKLTEDKQQSTYSRVWISFGDSILGLYCEAWLTQESVSLRILWEKKVWIMFSPKDIHSRPFPQSSARRKLTGVEATTRFPRASCFKKPTRSVPETWGRMYAGGESEPKVSLGYN